MIQKKKIIIHLIASSFYGGPEKQIVEHLKIIDSKNYDGILVSFIEKGEYNEILAKAKKENLKYYGIPMNGPLDFRALIALILFLRREKIDLICTHGFKASVLGLVASKINRIPIIAFSRGYTAENKKVRFYERLERAAIRRSNGIISVSEGQQKKLASFGIYGKKSWVVHNCVSTSNSSSVFKKEQICEEWNIPINSVIVVAAGRLSPEKGHRYLIKAIPAVIKQNKKVFFLICGDGVCREELELLSLKLNCIGNCIFTGFRRDINKIFSVMDLMVLPSLTEGLPNVILEAFACSKPVIATNVGGVPEIMVQGENGFLVSDGKPEVIADSIIKILNMKDLGKSLGEAGHNLVKSKFTFKAQNKQLESIYNEVL